MLTTKELISLREDIILGSLYYSDYKNTLNLKAQDVFDFFDAYLNYLEELMDEDTKDYSDEQFWEFLDKYDTDANLINFYHTYEYELEEEDEEVYL